MSTLLSAGISIMDAIDITKKNMPNVLYKDAMDLAHDEVSKGTPLTKPIEECGLFPPMICHMVKIGEETGNIEEMLDKSANYFEEEVEIATQSLLAAMEPAIIMVLAVIVIILIGACLAPMMTMYEALDNL
jgi:type IV pilus assembly protein PilC